MRRAFGFAILMTSALGVVDARAEIGDEQRSAAARAAERGEELARGQRFAEAAAQFASAYEILHSRGLAAIDDARLAGGYLYGWAQAERLAGNCSCAIALYREFDELARTRFPESRNWPEKASAGIAACPRVPDQRDQCHGVARPPATTASAPPVIVVAPSVPSVEPGEADPWYRDHVGDALAITGGLAFGAGIATLWSGYHRAREARAVGIGYDAYDASASAARWRVPVGWSVAGAGLALAAFAVVRFTTRPHPMIAADLHSVTAGIAARF